MENPTTLILSIIFGSGFITLLTLLLTWQFRKVKEKAEADQSLLQTESALLGNQNSLRETLDTLLNQLGLYAHRIAELTEQNIIDKQNCRVEKAQLMDIIDSLQKSEKKM